MTQNHEKHFPKKFLGNIVTLIIGLVILVAMVAFGFFSQPGEFENSDIVLDCLSQNVEILTGVDGIAHISAGNDADLLRTIGYLQATRQLPNLDRLLRLATGQMSAAHGKKFIELDIAAHQLDFVALAEQTLAELSPEAQTLFEAYCAGINAFIATQRHSVAQQFRLAGYEPHKWEPAECLAILQLFKWAYLSQWNEKIVVYKTGEVFGEERTRDGFPLIEPSTVRESGYQNAFFASLNQLYRDGVNLRRTMNLFPNKDKSLAWILAGKNVPADQTRLIFENNWFNSYDFIFDMAVLDRRIVGLFFPGVPICLASCNQQVAFGTNWLPENEVNLLVVRINPASEQYLAQDGWHNLRKRSTQIAVRSDHKQEVTFYHTDQGVILDYPIESVDTVAYAIVLKWQAVTASEINQRVALMLIGNNDAARVMTEVSSNLPGFVYLDQKGNYGSSALPKPLTPNLSTNCLTPFTIDDWRFSSQFTIDSLKSHFLPDWQNQPGTLFAESTDEIFPLLTADKYFTRLMKDVRAALPDTIFTRKTELQAYQNLIKWDGRYAKTAVGPTIYQAFLKALMRNIYSDELNLVDSETFEQFANSGDFAMQNLLLLIEKGESNWFDNLRTSDFVEWLGEIIRQSFREAVQLIEEKYSPNLSEWQWGRVNQDFVWGNNIKGKKFSNSKSVSLNSSGVVQTIILKPAGSETTCCIAVNGTTNPVEPVNLLTDRTELLRNGAHIMTLKASPKK